jgi:hypothetical protein
MIIEKKYAMSKGDPLQILSCISFWHASNNFDDKYKSNETWYVKCYVGDNYSGGLEGDGRDDEFNDDIVYDDEVDLCFRMWWDYYANHDTS